MSSNSNRPDIELALDVRSHERVLVIGGGSLEYPGSWIRMQSKHCHDLVTEDSVVVIDRTDVSVRVLESIACRGPRLVALVPESIDQEKSMRRLLSAMYPWAEVWTLSSSFGKLLVSNGVNGRSYDRDLVRDDRPVAEA